MRLDSISQLESQQGTPKQGTEASKLPVPLPPPPLSFPGLWPTSGVWKREPCLEAMQGPRSLEKPTSVGLDHCFFTFGLQHSGI